MDTAQNTPTTQLEPIPAKPKRRTIKPASVQAAVLAKHSIGQNKSQIAKDLDISRGTVDVILSQSDIAHQVQMGRSRIVGMIPKSVDVMEKRLAKDSESAAIAILRGTQVLQNQQVAVTQNNLQANTWITLRSVPSESTNTPSDTVELRVDNATSTQ